MQNHDSIYLNSEYLTQNPTWHVEHSEWKAAHVHRMLEDHRLVPDRIAEVGCGAGEILARLCALRPAAVCFGYEISPQAFALCCTRKTTNLEYYNRSVLDDNETFDLLLCMDVFEHVDDYIGFLRELKAKASYKVFHIPLDISAQSVLRGKPLLHIRRSVGHLHHFTASTALDTLRYCGYEIVESRYTAGSIDFDDRGWKARLMKYPRKLLFRLFPDACVRVLGGWSLLVLTK